MRPDIESEGGYLLYQSNLIFLIRRPEFTFLEARKAAENRVFKILPKPGMQQAAKF